MIRSQLFDVVAIPIRDVDGVHVAHIVCGQVFLAWLASAVEDGVEVWKALTEPSFDVNDLSAPWTVRTISGPFHFEPVCESADGVFRRDAERSPGDQRVKVVVPPGVSSGEEDGTGGVTVEDPAKDENYEYVVNLRREVALFRYNHFMM